MHEEFLDNIGLEPLFCHKCQTIVKEEQDYNWDYHDNEEHMFKCPNCNTRYIIRIDRPIEKMVFQLIEE